MIRNATLHLTHGWASNPGCFFCMCLTCIMLLTAACSGNAPQETKTQKSRKSTVQKQIKPDKKKIKKARRDKQESKDKDNSTAEVYTYDPAGKTDPFIPLVYDKKEGKKAAPTRMTSPLQTDKPLTPLQTYNLSELKLVAVIQGSEDNATALVEDPDGFGYIVRTGTLIGENNGVIKKIQSSRIIIEQRYISPTGNRESKIATLEINYQNLQ